MDAEDALTFSLNYVSPLSRRAELRKDEWVYGIRKD